MLKEFGTFVADVITLIFVVITAMWIYEHYIRTDLRPAPKRG